MRERLRVLYGERAGDETWLALQTLLERYRARLAGVPRGRPSLDQRAVVLITYGDSLLSGGQPPLRVLLDVASRHLAELVSTIHLLPCFPYSSDYGFSVVDYLQINPALGDWDDVAALRQRFGLMLDFVVNHVSAESEWFQAFKRGEPPYDRFFITTDPNADLSGVTRPRTTPLLTPVETPHGTRHVWTTFSADQVDLNYADPVVLLRMIEVMLEYVARGASLLRMDAIGFLWKELGTSCMHLPRTHQVVKLLREVLDAVAPSVAIITETNVPHADNIAYFGDGRDEAQMVYQFPLPPLVLDALARGDGSRLTGWAAALEPPSEQTTFFNFLASHDGVGVVPARGLLTDEQVQALARRSLAHGGQVSYKTNPDGTESPYELNCTWFDLLSDPFDQREPDATKIDRFVCSQAILLALAGVPGIYLHSLFGSHNDQAGYARSGWKRDLNHERLDAAALEARLADPYSETARVFGRYAALLRARRDAPAFHPAAPQSVLDAGPAVFALRRGPRQGQTVLALHNLSDRPTRLELAALAPTGGTWRDLLNARDWTAGQALQLAPYQVTWLAR